MPLAITGIGLTISVVQLIYSTLRCSELMDLFGSHLESLQSTVETVQAVLRDAESKQANGLELTAQEHDFIEKIKDVVYDADDLLDAYVTRAKQKHTRMESSEKFSTKVHKLGSRFKSLITGSPEARKIVDKLDKIGRDAKNYKFDCIPIRMMREETCSYVNENHIVGREEDLRKIVETLLDPIIQGELPVLAIVGMGGLGKTALAQLVYNDPRIQKEFSLMLWVCVSDQDRNNFNRKSILAKIFKSATGEKSIGDIELDPIVQKLRSKLDQHKYLLVLDDLWSEKMDECHNLVDILIGSGEKGSRIVVTTRSIKTANAIGSSRPHELQGLSEKNSWHLFEKKVGREIKEGHDLFEIGKDIVKKCVNVPLAINVVGSLLCGVDENKWQSFQKSRLLEIQKDDDDIMRILKFSYYHLSSLQKSCFTYCAIFPKDFKIQKENIISMWMAHDYVNNEVDAEKCFQILGQRSFFQDIEAKYRGKIEFKIHDLMHDMAQEIAGKEIYIANSATTQLDKKIRHLFDGAPTTHTEGFVTPSKVRSYVQDRYVFQERASDIQFPASIVLAKWRHLRVLHLNALGLRQLPKAIGKLSHLRHLDLSGTTQLEILPKALTKLINLQFLNLAGCYKLKELPRDLKKLVNLRALYVPEVLEYMPLGMGTMTSLTRLNIFIVGHRESCVKQEDMLESLGGLTNLKGSLDIWFKRDYKHAKEYCGEGGFICNTHLNSISIVWDLRRNEEWRVGNDEDLLEDLQPHRDLKELMISGYNGVRIPRWAREYSLTTSLPNLVKVVLNDCSQLKELPWLGRLRHLKILQLERLENVEYMENRRSIGSSSDDGGVSSNSSTMLFFPSLEQLQLKYMPKLKGWWGGSCIVNNDDDISMLTTTPAHPLPSFPRLSKLSIRRCPNLTSFHPLPKLKGWWRGSCIENKDDDINMLTTTPPHPLPSFPCLSKLYIWGCPNLTSFPLCPAVYPELQISAGQGFLSGWGVLSPHT